jgi:hypothetical protein
MNDRIFTEQRDAELQGRVVVEGGWDMLIQVLTSQLLMWTDSIAEAHPRDPRFEYILSHWPLEPIIFQFRVMDPASRHGSYSFFFFLFNVFYFLRQYCNTSWSNFKLLNKSFFDIVIMLSFDNSSSILDARIRFFF